MKTFNFILDSRNKKPKKLFLLKLPKTFSYPPNIFFHKSIFGWNYSVARKVDAKVAKLLPKEAQKVATLKNWF